MGSKHTKEKQSQKKCVAEKPVKQRLEVKHTHFCLSPSSAACITNQSLGAFAPVPDALLGKLLEFLEHSTVANVSACSKALFTLISSPATNSFWKNAYSNQQWGTLCNINLFLFSARAHNLLTLIDFLVQSEANVSIASSLTKPTDAATLSNIPKLSHCCWKYSFVSKFSSPTERTGRLERNLKTVRIICAF